MTTLPADSVRAVVQGACVQVLRSKDNFLKSIFSFTICGLLGNFKVTMAYIAGTLSQSKENESHICHLLTFFRSSYHILVYCLYCHGYFVYCDILIILSVFELFFFFQKDSFYF